MRTEVRRPLACILMAACSAAAAAPVFAASAGAQDALSVLKWHDSLKVGKALSDENQRPLLVYFSASWCSVCRQMSRQTFGDENVRQALRAFVLVKLDVDDEETSLKAATEFHVRGIPHTVILSPSGRVLSQFRGYVGPERFGRHVAKLAKPYVRGSADPGSAQKQKALRWMNGQDITSDRWDGVIDILAELRGDPDIQDAIKRHEDFPAAELVRALRDRSLAVRLAAFEVLQDVSGEDFSFDPWSAVDAQKEPLRKWDKWAKGVKDSGLPKTLFVPLTKERIRVLIGDLLGSDHQRSRRARRRLSQSGKPGLEAIRDIAAHLPELNPADRLKIQEVLFSIQVPYQLSHNRVGIAHALVYGDIEGKTAAIKTLQSRGGVNALGLMAELLRDENPLVREAAIEATRMIGTGAARELLLTLKDEKDLNVRVTLITNLAYSKASEAMDFLLANLKGPEELALAALKGLRRWDADKLSVAAVAKVTKSLRPLFKDKRWRVRSELLETISKMELRGLDDGIIQCLNDKDDFVRKNAMLICGRRKLRQARKRLLEMFQGDHAMKPTVIGVLLQIDPSAVTREVAAELMKAPEDVILSTVNVLANYEALPATIMFPLLDSKKQDLRVAAIRAVGEVAQGYSCEDVDPAVLNKVIGLMTNEHPQPIRLEALQAFATFNWSEYMEELADLRRRREWESERSRPRGLLARILGTGSRKQPKLSEAIKQRIAVKDSVIAQAGSCLKETAPDIRYQAALVLGRVGALDGVEIIQARNKETSTSVEEKIKIVQVLSKLLKGPAELKFPDKRVLDSVEKVRARSKELTGKAETLLAGMFEQQDAKLLEQLSRNVTELQNIRLSHKVLGLIKAKRIDFDTAFDVLESQTRSASPIEAGSPRKLSAFQRQILEFARPEIKSPDKDLRHFSLILLGRVGEKSDIPQVRAFLDAKDDYVRRSALIALFRMDPAAGRAQAEKMLDDPFWGVPYAGLRILGHRPSDSLYLYDKMGPGDWFGYSSYPRFIVTLVEPEGEFDPSLKKSIIAAAIKLLKHENLQVRHEAGKLLLKHRVKTDYREFVRTLESGEFSDYEIVSILEERWPWVPVEFYSFLKKSYAQSRNSSTLKLIGRIDSKEIKLITRREKEEFDELLRRAKKVPELKVPKRAAAAPSGAARYAVAYFYQRGCRDCGRVSGYLEQLQKDFRNLEVRKYNVLPTDGAMFNEVLCQRAEIPANQRQVVPAVFTSSKGLIGERISLENLLGLILSSENQPAPWEIEAIADGAQLLAATERIKDRHAGKGAVWVVGMGLVDGINPCAFTVIIFFLSYLAYVGRKKRELLVTGAMFTVGVFLTYLLIGFGLLEAIQALKFMPTLSACVYWATALFALVVGVLSFRDGILCLKGRIRDVSLQLPSRIKTMIHGVIRRQTRMRTIVVASLATGFLISLLELACTGQVYLPAIVFISKGNVQGTLLLLLYNVAFITPLCVIFTLAYFGLSSEALTRFFQKHVATIKFMLAGLFFGLFGLLVIFT